MVNLRYDSAKLTNHIAPSDGTLGMKSTAIQHVRAFLHETRASIRLAVDVSSWWRLFRDIVRRRFLRFVPSRQLNRPRQLRIHGGGRLAYRFNRGDLQSLREVWMDSAYRPPFPTPSAIVVDLGANIGLTSVWFYRQFQCESIIAVEADESNARLAEENFLLNSIPGEVIHAAIGPRDGWVRFAKSDESNAGHVIEGHPVENQACGHGEEVRMVSMRTVMERLPAGRRIDILKVDIEGGEGVLFDGDLSWLGRVDGIVIELHPDVTDTLRVRCNIEALGFKYIPPGSVFPINISAFVRTSGPV